MKKLMLLIALLACNFMLAIAQEDIVLYIEDRPDDLDLCIDDHQRVIIYAQENCEEFQWGIDTYSSYDNPIIIDWQHGSEHSILYNGFCDGFSHVFMVFYHDNRVPTSFTHDVWKRQGSAETIEAVGIDSTGWAFSYSFLWSTGSTERTIDVTEPGIYTCEITQWCGTATRTFIVRDNVEISLATCDLETNLNMVTWPTTPAQAEYVSQVEVKRDGLVVGTAPYTDGYFIDNIGSDAASRTYTVTALATDGAPCPIASYPKETIHMAYLTGVNNTIEVNWNQPTGYDLLGYNICEWHPGAKEDLTVIDYVGAGVTSYTCSESMFDEGNIVVQGVEAGKDGESRLLSNRSWETVGIGEHQNKFNVYPNPTNGTFTVDGATDLTVFNTLGQVITTSHSENGTHTFTLRSGIYFIKSDEGTVQKIVVE